MKNKTYQLNRRLFLGQSVGGLGALALSHLLNEQAVGATLSPKPRAKAIISLFQHGGPSHVDMFDPTDISVGNYCTGNAL